MTTHRDRMSSLIHVLIAAIMFTLAASSPASGQVARPAAAHRSGMRVVHADRADSATRMPTLMHDVRIGAAIGGVSGFLLGAYLASVDPAKHADFIVCAPLPQGFACDPQRKASMTPVYLAAGAAGGAILGAVMGAGYHQNRTP